MQIPEEDRELVNRRLMDEYDCYPVYLADDLADRHYNGMSGSPSFPLILADDQASPTLSSGLFSTTIPER
jgi:hypothetical protein